MQLGIPSSKEQYIHRLGRTGRAGKEGQGVLILTPDEAFFSKELRDLPITKINDPQPSEHSFQVSSPPPTLVAFLFMHRSSHT